ncbi:Flagellar biosynthesis/type III secretory pathway protein FliH [Roseateles sp. YR242]|uniref:FliH/SctL family protein n=1 Tax=Roseateles sp. YR242 TaxID=1855305 RepID=UPI0008BD1F29|nr:FliH/SctL family protein [Roseateles sp. YR242]SEK51704.1 Flagellar biosynthesis/type III secretory pathway protein FliH [Roseateles sp. YR242]
MNPNWITRRHRLAGTHHHLEDEDGVLSAEALQVVVKAADLTGAVRARCAARLRAARARQREQLFRQREACEARVLAEVALLSRSLQNERRDLRASASDLVAQVARDALKRLMLALPEAWPVQSSVELVLDEWGAMKLKDEAVVHVHPDDLPMVAPAGKEAPWTFEADASIARGSCVLTHSAGTVQADFQANVTALHAALANSAASDVDPDVDPHVDIDPHPTHERPGVPA